MEHFSILEAVEVALNMEEEGILFYTLAEQKVKDPAMKELFADLRNREHHHVEVFQRLYGDLASKEGDPDADLYLLDPGMSEYFRAYVRSVVFPEKGAAGPVIAGLHGVVDILQLALRVEKESILFYHELLARHPYPAARELLEKVIKEEREHFSFIAQRLASLSG